MYEQYYVRLATWLVEQSKWFGTFGIWSRCIIDFLYYNSCDKSTRVSHCVAGVVIIDLAFVHLCRHYRDHL